MPFLIIGVISGALAFGLLLLALVPVIRRKRNASMAKGSMSVAASFAVLLLGVIVVYLLAHDGLLAYLVGELMGFLVGWIVLACVLVAR
ncbi:hypothetical protein K6V98_04385 [Collinsella sp. AGMB00827]|uniref:Uncharacterized protein n=2 Tax=Collinsella ureilytica TaxID=2869515 RepID=A0ABS7MJP3_9ACTN|nr:hypothetical protein [Collinsella urealyticum]MBY4797592.1 hypothetical protein [Collinsella urealyticum]